MREKLIQYFKSGNSSAQIIRRALIIIEQSHSFNYLYYLQDDFNHNIDITNTYKNI
ncbi:hypothetical protein pb186bvf_010574 [Paramecium bursaria]